MPRQIVHGALSVLTLVVASSAWAAPAPWVPNTTGNVGPAPTTFNKWEAIEAPAASGASCGNGSPYRFFVNRTTTTDMARRWVPVADTVMRMTPVATSGRPVTSSDVRRRRWP